MPKRALPEHSKSDILEIKVARCAEPEKELSLYGRHQPGYKCARLDLNQIEVAYGEEFWVRSVGKYLPQKLASEYNLMKPIGLENTELILDGRPCLRVDGTEVRLAVKRFRTFESKAILDVEFGSGGLIRVIRGLEGFNVKTRNHSQVYSMMTDGRQVLITYKMPGESMHTRVVDSSTASYSTVNSVPEIGSRADLLAIPDSFEGRYVIRLNSRFMVHMIAKLVRHGACRYEKVRGDIGEEIIDSILSQIGVPQLIGHPLDPGRDYDSSRKGPDSLRKVPIVQLGYFEFKWWKEAEKASYEAQVQASRFPRGKRFRGQRIGGAYIANLDWDMSSPMCSLTVSRVW